MTLATEAIVQRCGTRWFIILATLSSFASVSESQGSICKDDVSSSDDQPMIIAVLVAMTNA